MSRVIYSGGAGPAASLTQTGSVSNHSFTGSSLVYNSPSYGAEDPRRRIFLLLVGTGVNTVTSIVQGVDTLDLAVLPAYTVAVASILRPTGVDGQAFTISFSTGSTKYFSIWASSVLNIVRPVPFSYGDGALVSAVGSFDIQANTRSGGIVLGGMQGVNNGSYSFSGIANAEEYHTSTNPRLWALWEESASGATPKTVTVTQSGTSPTGAGVIFAYR